MADKYRVTGQREVLALNDKGDAVRSMEVDAETVPNGVAFTEQIPVSAYNATHVHDVLDARASSIEAVHGL